MLKRSGFFEMACDLTGVSLSFVCAGVCFDPQDMHADTVPSAGTPLKDKGPTCWLTALFSPSVVWFHF